MTSWICIGILSVLVLGEVGFRILLRRRGIRFSPPKAYRNLYMISHPYLPYVYKPHALIGYREPAPYPLHRGRYEFRARWTNNIRFLGPDVSIAKAPDGCRVMCLGASTTANAIWEVGDPTEHTYPRDLQEALHQRAAGRRYEVLNCGMGGWTSAEILINFAITLIDLKPDIVVLYHGGNDLEASLTAPFASDYSHSRKNFGEAYARVRVASYLPSLRWWKSYAFLKAKLMGFGNIRYDVLSSVRVGKASLDNPFLGLETERRNLEHLIHLCKARRIQLLLCTFAYHVYAQVARDRLTLKYREGVALENRMLRELAEQHALPLVDSAAQLPDDDAYFVDTMHFTPLGMRTLAHHVAAAILALQEADGPAARGGNGRRQIKETVGRSL